MPALMRAARSVYGSAIRAALGDAGCDDVPRNGVFVLGAMARADAPLSEIVAQLGTSKQTAGQLVDSLVTRGYLSREVDPQDRRRLVVSLTERGEGAATVIRSAIQLVDDALVAKVGSEHVSHTRATLAALVEGLSPAV
jgi:DNA-binding MarR family transcriptional regulator